MDGNHPSIPLGGTPVKLCANVEIVMEDTGSVTMAMMLTESIDPYFSLTAPETMRTMLAIISHVRSGILYDHGNRFESVSGEAFTHGDPG